MGLYPFLNYVNICKICSGTGSAITLKTSSVGSKTENLRPVYSVNGLGFTVVL